MTISQIAAVTAKAAAETPWPAQGDTEANPSPEPSANKTSDTEVATNAPARIAAHDTVEIDFAENSRESASAERGNAVVSIFIPYSMVRTHGQEQDDWNGNTQEPKKNSATHDQFPLL